MLLRNVLFAVRQKDCSDESGVADRRDADDWGGAVPSIDDDLLFFESMLFLCSVR